MEEILDLAEDDEVRPSMGATYIEVRTLFGGVALMVPYRDPTSPILPQWAYPTQLLQLSWQEALKLAEMLLQAAGAAEEIQRGGT